jgi:hypothetical protein
VRWASLLPGKRPTTLTGARPARTPRLVVSGHSAWGKRDGLTYPHFGDRGKRSADSFPVCQVSLGAGSAGSVIAASPQAEVAGGHSVNADEQRDEPERPENILGHCFLPNRPLTKPCRRQCTPSAANVTSAIPSTCGRSPHSPLGVRPKLRRNGGALILSEVLVPVLSVVCEPCGLRERHDVQRLMRQYGSDAKLTDLLPALVRDCDSRSITPVRGFPSGKVRVCELGRGAGLPSYDPCP